MSILPTVIAASTQMCHQVKIPINPTSPQFRASTVPAASAALATAARRAWKRGLHVKHAKEQRDRDESDQS